MYEKQGYVGGEFGNVVGLIVGIAVASLILVFTSSLAGTAYNLVEDDITNIAGADLNYDPLHPDYNTNIQILSVENSVNQSAQSGFNAMETVGDYLPLIVLAIVIFIILGLIMGLGSPRMYSGGSL